MNEVESIPSLEDQQDHSDAQPNATASSDSGQAAVIIDHPDAAESGPIEKAGEAPEQCAGYAKTCTTTDLGMNDRENPLAPPGTETDDGEVEATEEAAHDDSPAENTQAIEGNAARSVSALFKEGVASMKEVNAARRAHATARDDLERLERSIANQEQELEHRRDVEARYNEIVDSELARKDEAGQQLADAEQQLAVINDKLTTFKKALEDAREKDATVERRLKSALDAAEDKERSARESGRRLQRRLDDAQANLDRAGKEREDCIAAARQALTSAEAHLTTLNSEYAEIQRNPSANPAGYSVRKRELENEISDATEAIRNAKGEIPRIERETQTAIDEARSAVSEAERPITAARDAFEAAAATADRARDAYGKAKDEAEKRQKELRSTITEGEKKAKAQQRLIQEAQGAIDAAQRTIHEAHEIHAHPEVTIELAQAIEAQRVEREHRATEVEQLAANEKHVRDQTRGARMRLALAACGFALIVALLIAWTYFAR